MTTKHFFVSFFRGDAISYTSRAVSLFRFESTTELNTLLTFFRENLSQHICFLVAFVAKLLHWNNFIDNYNSSNVIIYMLKPNGFQKI